MNGFSSVPSRIPNDQVLTADLQAGFVSRSAWWMASLDITDRGRIHIADVLNPKIFQSGA
jgi:hypothetical protein